LVECLLSSVPNPCGKGTVQVFRDTFYNNGLENSRHYNQYFQNSQQITFAMLGEKIAQYAMVVQV
jgi:hypothetical protein